MLPNGYKQFMQEKINNFYIENNRLPTKQDLKDYSVEPLIFEYGNWKQVLIELGFKNTENVETEFQDLLQLQDNLEGLPSLEEAKEVGINTKLLIQKYDGWRNVKKELKKNMKNTYKIKKTKLNQFNEKIEKDEEILKNITIKYAKLPTVQMAINNGVEINRVLKKYGTWMNAKKELDLYDIYEKTIIEKIKEMKTNDRNRIEKELKKAKYIYKPDLKPLIQKYGSWISVCKNFNLISEFTENEEKEIEKNLENLKLIEKIIGGFPDKNVAASYDINVELLVKKYGKWENVKR